MIEASGEALASAIKASADTLKHNSALHETITDMVFDTNRPQEPIGEEKTGEGKAGNMATFGE